MGSRILGVLVCLALAVLLAGPAAPLWAHASFLRSDPPANSVLDSSPERLRLWFTEPLEPSFSEVRVLNQQGQPVDRGDSRVTADDPLSMLVTLPPLEKAAYTVSWKALSKVDGHVTRGTFSLFIGVAPSPTALDVPQELSATVPIEAAIRWLGYLGVALLVGPLLTLLAVLLPAATRLGWRDSVLPAAVVPLRRLLRWGWAGLLVATLGALALQAALVTTEAAGGFYGSVGGLLFGTRYGAVWLARLALALGLGLVLRSLAKEWDTRPAWAGVGLGGAILLTFSLNSHSAAVGDLSVVAVLADWLHLWAVVAWAGGLVALAVVLPGALSPLPGAHRTQLLAAMIPRFSAMAAIAVAALILTGLYQAWLHVNSFGALFETLYGKSLVAKVLLVTPLLLLGAANLLVVRPRLATAVANAARYTEAARLADRFARTVAAEAVLAVLVIAAAGVLTSFPPARQTYEQILGAQPLHLYTVVQDLSIAVAITPSRPGPGAYTVTLTGPDGRPVDNAELVQLSFTYLDQALGSAAVRASSEGDGLYLATGAEIGVEGRWQIEVLVRRAGRDDARAAFRATFAASSAQEEPSTTSGTPRLPRGTTDIAGLGLAIFGVALLLYVARTLGLRSTNGLTLAFVSLAVAGLGVFLVVRSQPGAASSDLRSIVNPFPPTQQSLAIGEGIYRTQCQMCHGVNGQGDGPVSVSLNPKPADFRVHMAAGHTDGELFNWTSNGVPGTAMPAFSDKLTQEERWHVINFIRTYAPVESKALTPPTERSAP